MTMDAGALSHSVESTGEIDRKAKTETRFYLTSSADNAEKLAGVVRQHWAIENSLD